jgi:hypothetical protein
MIDLLSYSKSRARRLEIGWRFASAATRSATYIQRMAVRNLHSQDLNRARTSSLPELAGT